MCLGAKTASLLSKPPSYKNPPLQQIIDEGKTESCLDLSGKKLTDADMELVSYYLLQNNKVSDVAFVCCCRRKGQEMYQSDSVANLG